MCHTLFENIDYPLVGLDLVGVDDADGHVLERSNNTGICQWISREKLHIKHVPYVDFKILTTFLSHSQWLSLSTPMGVIMMMNLVGC